MTIANEWARCIVVVENDLLYISIVLLRVLFFKLSVEIMACESLVIMTLSKDAKVFAFLEIISQTNLIGFDYSSISEVMDPCFLSKLRNFYQIAPKQSFEVVMQFHVCFRMIWSPTKKKIRNRPQIFIANTTFTFSSEPTYTPRLLYVVCICFMSHRIGKSYGSSWDE